LPARDATIRSFHTRHWLRQQSAKAEEEVKGEVNEEPVRDANASGEAEASKTKTEEKTGPGSEEQQAGEEGAKEQKAKDESLPPPPHGDKTPWQVFTETLRSEFKASKEWNESTKQLAAGYQDFTQNEAIKKAKSAYNQTSDAVGSTTSAALKNTGRAIGQGAAWAWETPVVKGLRKGAEATGKGIEKVTRPIRETEAYKNVKETIDDGASSRYGGWMEKEERKRRRELREAKEAQNGRKPTEPMVEDPKYEIFCSLFAQ
jgi:import inner membrane translocase subunit TIM44